MKRLRPKRSAVDLAAMAHVAAWRRACARGWVKDGQATRSFAVAYWYVQPYLDCCGAQLFTSREEALTALERYGVRRAPGRWLSGPVNTFIAGSRWEPLAYYWRVGMDDPEEPQHEEHDHTDAKR